jgi:ATPase subunit of ABC transporter with duplicated ATPase domains
MGAALLSTILVTHVASPAQAQVLQNSCNNGSAAVFGSNCDDVARENQLRGALQKKVEEAAKQEKQHEEETARAVERAVEKDKVVAEETAKFEKLREEVKQRFVEICENHADRPVSPNTPGPAICRTVAVQ